MTEEKRFIVYKYLMAMEFDGLAWAQLNFMCVAASAATRC